jgi:hypothetical protein
MNQMSQLQIADLDFCESNTSHLSTVQGGLSIAVDAGVSVSVNAGVRAGVNVNSSDASYSLWAGYKTAAAVAVGAAQAVSLDGYATGSILVYSYTF